MIVTKMVERRYTHTSGAVRFSGRESNACRRLKITDKAAFAVLTFGERTKSCGEVERARGDFGDTFRVFLPRAGDREGDRGFGDLDLVDLDFEVLPPAALFLRAAPPFFFMAGVRERVRAMVVGVFIGVLGDGDVSLSGVSCWLRRLVAMSNVGRQLLVLNL